VHPSAIHAVLNMGPNWSESMNFGREQDLKLARSYKICLKHTNQTKVVAAAEIEELFITHKIDLPEHFIHPSDPSREEKLQLLEYYKKCPPLEREFLTLIKIRHSIAEWKEFVKRTDRSSGMFFFTVMLHCIGINALHSYQCL
jgi:hypothetical protein